MGYEISIRAACEADAPAIQAIYAPIVRDTVISFEEDPPSVEEIASRIRKP
jgi:phosphinothricin acetyltransferase